MGLSLKNENGTKQSHPWMAGRERMGEEEGGLEAGQ